MQARVHLKAEGGPDLGLGLPHLTFGCRGRPEGSGFRVHSPGFKFQGSRYGPQGSGYRPHLDLRVHGAHPVHEWKGVFDLGPIPASCNLLRLPRAPYQRCHPTTAFATRLDHTSKFATQLDHTSNAVTRPLRPDKTISLQPPSHFLFTTLQYRQAL